MNHATLLLAGLTFAGLSSGAADAQENAAANERLFRTRCGACHTVQEGQNRIGPHLANVIGRTAGTVEGVRYSAGMKDLHIVWDETNLNTFLANPKAMVPNTSMPVSVPSEADRATIITYLRSLSASPK